MLSSRVLVASPGHVYLAHYSEGGSGSDSTSLATTHDFPVSGNPSWMILVEPDLIYAVDEAGTTTRVFQLSSSLSNGTDSTGEQVWTLKTITEAQGSDGVCHLEFNRGRTRMLGSAYENGTIDIWNTEGNGLKLIKTIRPDVTLGPAPRQDRAHPHQAVLDPTSRYFIVNDLGTDHMLLIDGKDDAFDVINHIPVAPAGCGPRHGVFYPAGTSKATHYILLCELGNQIVVWALDYKKDNVEFIHVQTISTFDPNNPPAKPAEACAGEIVIVDHDVYISNRLTGDPTDSLGHFRIDPSHEADKLRLEFVSQISSGGILPRMFSLTENKRTLLVGNQRGKMGVVAFARADDGKLEAKPMAIIPGTEYGPEGSTLGPQFVQQI